MDFNQVAFGASIWNVSLIDEAFICFRSFPPASQEGTIIVLHVPRVLRVLQNVVTVIFVLSIVW